MQISRYPFIHPDDYFLDDNSHGLGGEEEYRAERQAVVVAEHDAEWECVENTADEEDDEHVEGCANGRILYPERSHDEFRVGAQRLWKARSARF